MAPPSLCNAKKCVARQLVKTKTEIDGGLLLTILNNEICLRNDNMYLQRMQLKIRWNGNILTFMQEFHRHAQTPIIYIYTPIIYISILRSARPAKKKQ